MEPLSFVFADKATVPGFLGTDVQDEVIRHILDVKPDKILLVCDQSADELHGDYFKPLSKETATCASVGSTADGAVTSVAELPDVAKRVMPPGDACKSWDHLTELVQWAFEEQASKRSLVVAFGGGALLNLTGLFASMLYRGTKLIYVPTTFLAMHDVVTSLKTSICYDGRKNNIGSFYAPIKILIDVGFCRTLPRFELFSGVGELAKNAAILGGKHAEGFVDALSKERVNGASGGSGEEFVMEDKTLLGLLRLGVEAKMSVLLTDALEKTSGMIFEYGHTVSHAIEKAYGDGTIPHGLGVTYGMLSSSFAAERLGIMSAEDRKEHDSLCWLLLDRWPLPEPKPSVEKVMELAMRDSKRGITLEAEDEISDVLLYKMGYVVPTSTSNLSKFPCKLVAEWLATMGFPVTSPPSDAAVPQVSAAECEAMLRAMSCSNDAELRNAGFETLEAGFANRVCALEKHGQAVVAKRYTDLVFLRSSPQAVGALDALAGRTGIGPKVLYSGHQGVVMERLPGRTLEEADMHRNDRHLLEAVAQALASLHQLELPPICHGEPMLWRTVDKMLEALACRPDLMPDGVPSLGALLVEVRSAKAELAKHDLGLVSGHGDFKPSNVMEHEGRVKLIDFELGGPNYRGFDLYKVFRTAGPQSEASMVHFIRKYLEFTEGEIVSDEASAKLMAEMRLFEPLTWLEAYIFFLILPQFKPEKTAEWADLARDRWSKYQESRAKLFS